MKNKPGVSVQMVCPLCGTPKTMYFPDCSWDDEDFPCECQPWWIPCHNGCDTRSVNACFTTFLDLLKTQARGNGPEIEPIYTALKKVYCGEFSTIETATRSEQDFVDNFLLSVLADVMDEALLLRCSPDVFLHIKKQEDILEITVFPWAGKERSCPYPDCSLHCAADRGSLVKQWVATTENAQSDPAREALFEKTIYAILLRYLKALETDAIYEVRPLPDQADFPCFESINTAPESVI